MSEKITQIILEIEKIQKARQANWESTNGPTDEALETEHVEKLARLRAELNREWQR